MAVFLFSKGIVIQKHDETMFPVHRKYLINLTDLEIVSTYNAELRGICNYYGIASNFNKLHYFAYLMEHSCLKTLASKHKCQMSKIIDKFRDNTAKNKGKWSIPYETKGGKKRCYLTKYTDCKDSKNVLDTVSNAAVLYGYSRNTLESRLKEKCCELCGTTESDHYEIHHVNKVKNLKGKEAWEIAMIANKPIVASEPLVINCARNMIYLLCQKINPFIVLVYYFSLSISRLGNLAVFMPAFPTDYFPGQGIHS